MEAPTARPCWTAQSVLGSSTVIAAQIQQHEKYSEQSYARPEATKAGVRFAATTDDDEDGPSPLLRLWHGTLVDDADHGESW